MDLDTLRQIIQQESPSRLELGTVISADPRGARTISVRLSGGRVCSRVRVCVEGLEVGDQVLVARLMQTAQVVVLGRVSDETHPTLARYGILAPPSNLAATAVPAAIVVRWDTYPGEDLAWWVQYNTSASADGATDVLVTRGSYYMHYVVDDSGDMATAATYHFRVRGMRWLGDNNVMYSGWSNWTNATSGGHNLRELVELELQNATELTISGGAVTRTQVYHSIDTEGDAGTDDLVTINGGTEGDLLVLRPASDARTVVVKHNVGNIWLGGSDLTMDDLNDHAVLICAANGYWCGLGGGSGGGGATTFLQLTDTPSSYTGQARRLPAVNDAESALQFMVAAGWLKVGSVSDIKWQPDCLAVLRAGVITGYADPDDAFTNATQSGDVVLIPPGTWALSAQHNLPNGVSVAGLGNQSDCLLQADYLLGINQGAGSNFRIERVVNSSSGEDALYASYSYLYHVEAFCQNTGNGEADGAYLVHSSAFDCYFDAQAMYDSMGVRLFSSEMYWCRARGYTANSSMAYSCGAFMENDDCSVYWCRLWAKGTVGTDYGLWCSDIDNLAYQCVCYGQDADIRLEASAALSIHDCQFNTTSLGAGATLTCLPGDRAAKALNETITGDWAFVGLLDAKELEFADAAQLTISGGVVTRTQTYHKVETEGGAASDDLDTISGGTEGDLLVLRPVDDTHTVVVKHNTGNIWLAGGTSISLNDINDHLALVYDGSKWCDISGGAGGGGVTDHGELGGLGDDDHPQYAALAQDETITGTWTHSAAIKGSGTPSLGTSTESEKWGIIYVASGKDVYAEGEAGYGGLMRRGYNRYGVDTYTSHARTDPGLSIASAPAALYAAENPGYTGLWLDTYYRMYPSNAALPTYQLMHTADPITGSAKIAARLLVAGSCEIGLRVDNYDSDYGYVNGKRIYAFDIYLVGSGALTDIKTRYAYSEMSGGVWGAWNYTAIQSYTGAWMVAEGITFQILINNGGTAQQVSYLVGEQGSLSGLGNATLYNDNGVTQYNARRAGVFCRLLGYGNSSWDWYRMWDT